MSTSILWDWNQLTQALHHVLLKFQCFPWDFCACPDMSRSPLALISCFFWILIIILVLSTWLFSSLYSTLTQIMELSSSKPFEQKAFVKSQTFLKKKKKTREGMVVYITTMKNNITSNNKIPVFKSFSHSGTGNYLLRILTSCLVSQLFLSPIFLFTPVLHFLFCPQPLLYYNSENFSSSPLLTSRQILYSQKLTNISSTQRASYSGACPLAPQNNW